METNQKIPNHIAFIMDGNGRWAKERDLERTEGHKVGIEKIDTLIKCGLKYHINEISVYAFSTENWNRPKKEVDYLFKYMRSFFKKFKKGEYKGQVKVRVIGDVSRLSNDDQKIIKEVTDLTKDNTDLIFNIALNYGGKDDILYGVKNILNDKSIDIEKLTFDDFRTYCRSGEMSNIDLLVRTGREMRISNFMPLELLYSELYFDDVLWPDFSEAFFKKVLEQYSLRFRRFGGIKE